MINTKNFDPKQVALDHRQIQALLDIINILQSNRRALPRSERERVLIAEIVNLRGQLKKVQAYTDQIDNRLGEWGRDGIHRVKVDGYDPEDGIRASIDGLRLHGLKDIAFNHGDAPSVSITLKIS